MKLPEKSFFTLRDLAKQWDCSDNDIASFVFDGRLRVGIKLSGQRATRNSSSTEEPLRGFYSLSHDDGKDASGKHDSAIKISTVYELPAPGASTNESAPIELVEPKVVGWRNLRVALQERDRFVRDHSTKNGKSEGGLLERKNLLRTIAVLAGMYAESQHQLENWSDLKANQVAAALHKFLDDHRIDKKGLGLSSIRDRTSQGTNLVEELDSDA